VTNLFEKLPAWPEDDFSAFGATETVKRSRIQQLVGKFLSRNWLSIPHVTHHDNIDITDIEQRRLDWNLQYPTKKISPVVYVIKALSQVLFDFPQFASSLDASGEIFTVKKFAHIGVAVEVTGGLLVPVLRDCDKKPMSSIAAELTEISSKARTKGLSMQEMAGGCISISSLGHIGGIAFTPIVNAPEVAILGLTKIQDVPAQAKGETAIVWRKMLPVSLSYDHRVINGADAARFVVALGKCLDTLNFS
jgi:pyruvate dehydrogenase E2 component (dihydrolipoamide acetyltransferase)